jgi:hypothetical protein
MLNAKILPKSTERTPGWQIAVKNTMLTLTAKAPQS